MMDHNHNGVFRSQSRELKEHCQRLNSKIWAMEEDLDRSKEQNATLTRKVEKQRAQFQRLVSATEESNQKDSAQEDLREEELAELRKVREATLPVETPDSSD